MSFLAFAKDSSDCIRRMRPIWLSIFLVIAQKLYYNAEYKRLGKVMRTAKRQRQKCKPLQSIGRCKKAPYFVFHPKVVFYNLFQYFSDGVDSRPGRFFWQQYGSNWTLYYAAPDENHRGVLCRKISSSDTAAMQERFWQEQCTWWKDNSTFGGQFSEDRKRGRCPQRSTLFIVRCNSWEYLEFMGTPWGIPQKINTPSLTRNWHFENISF